MWSWKNVNGSYQNYDDTHSKLIEFAYQKDQNGAMKLTMNGTIYDLCFQTMKQKNQKGVTVSIQRLGLPTGPSAPTISVPTTEMGSHAIAKRDREDAERENVKNRALKTRKVVESEEKSLAKGGHIQPPVSLAPVVTKPSAGSTNPIVLAFPSISTNIFMFDVEKAAAVACGVIQKFLRAHSIPKFSTLCLMLVDVPPHGKSSLEDSEALAAFQKRWKTINEEGETRFILKVADITDLSSRGPCLAIANATNQTFAGGPATGGVNRAIHLAAGKELQSDSRYMYPEGAAPGGVYPVALRASSGLYAQGVRHVMHVLGPNMNPMRPNCLHGDYTTGCKQLTACYEALFTEFVKLYFA